MNPMQQLQRPTPDRGFTSIELLMVIASVEPLVRLFWRTIGLNNLPGSLDVGSRDLGCMVFFRPGDLGPGPL